MSNEQMVKVLELARDELHEMMLAQKHHTQPRNPEITKAAYDAVSTVLLDIRGEKFTAEDMLRHVIGSLKLYPNGGGDAGVMAEVDRIVKEAKDVTLVEERSRLLPDGPAQAVEPKCETPQSVPGGAPHFKLNIRHVGSVEMAHSLLEWNLQCCHDTCVACRKNIIAVRWLLKEALATSPVEAPQVAALDAKDAGAQGDVMKTTTTAGQEAQIRVIEMARNKRPEEQAALEKLLGGLDLSRWERPYREFSDDELFNKMMEEW